MSDSMTTGEIEDVLSSIRRLVSDDTRMVFRAVPRPPADGRLLLTPALRVAPPGADVIPYDDAIPDDPGPDHATSTRIGTVVTAIAATVTPPADGWESETGDLADIAVPFASMRTPSVHAQALATPVAAAPEASPPGGHPSARPRPGFIRAGFPRAGFPRLGHPDALARHQRLARMGSGQ